MDRVHRRLPRALPRRPVARMPDEPIIRSYRVTYVNRHNGVRYSVIVTESSEWLMRAEADQMLMAHLTRTAGHVSDWAHYSTVEVSA